MKSAWVLPFVLVLPFLSGAAFAAEPTSAGSAPGTATFWFIPHTHWEGAVFKTRQEYLEMGLANILRALRLLAEHPNYRFTLDQACYVKPFLARYPEEEAAFKRFVAEGRLAIVGGTDVMPDVNMPSGESFVRQVLYGKGYFRKKLGVDVTVGWQLDTFGHHPQMPQVLSLAGYKSFWFFRGVRDWDVPSEFLWQGIDGSRIAAFWLPQGYAITYGSPKTLPEFTKSMLQRFELLNRQARGTDRVGLAGADVSEPEEHVPGLVEAFGHQPGMPFRLRLAAPADFEKAVAARPDRPVLEGDLNPIFQGAYSSRIELKQEQRDLERLLTTAEKLAALGQSFGLPSDGDALWRAWEPVLFNQTHDLASGVMTDHVYEDTRASYRFSRRLTEELVESGLDAIGGRINTAGEGIPIVVWNMLGWPRSDLAEVEVGFSEKGVVDLGILDAAGQAVPVQIVEALRGSDGGLLRAKIAFIAREVPAMGYSLYRIVPRKTSRGRAVTDPVASGRSAPPHPDPLPHELAATTGFGRTTFLRRQVHGGEGTEYATACAEGPSMFSPSDSRPLLENEHCRLAIDPKTGAVASLCVKPANWEALAGPANVVSREHDGGDLWELYQPLDGGSRIAMTRKQAVPQPGKARFSHECASNPGTVVRGPVFSEFRVAHPFGPDGTFSTRVRLYAGLPRIDFQTRIFNQQKFVRYQAHFPTSIAGGRNVQEIPFGAVERPLAIEFPAQNWADYGDGKRGISLLNRGLPGNLTSGQTMLLSLARSTRIVAYGFAGGYEPGMSSDTGLELGKELTFDYALVPHDGDWRKARSFRHGLEFNNPLVVRKAVPQAGPLPGRWGWLEVSHPNVVVSAIKPGPAGTVVLRLYEAAGSPAPGVEVKLHAKVVSAEECNLMEDPGRKVEVAGDALKFDLGRFQIKTFRVQVK